MQITDLHMEVQGDYSVITSTSASQVMMLPFQRVLFSSSLEKPERPQYSICQSALEPFISTLCTYLEEKKITHKHKHITGGRAPTSSCTPSLSPLPPCHTARWEGPFVLLVAAETGPSLLGSAQGSYTEYSETYLLP